MNVVQSILKLFFGTKSDKDRKEIQPYVDKILALYPSIDALDNDALRGRSDALKAQIADFIRPEEERIAALKVELEGDLSIEKKSDISKEIDNLTKEVDEKIEKKLDEIEKKLKKSTIIVDGEVVTIIEKGDSKNENINDKI